MACFELTLCLVGGASSVLGKGSSSPASSCLHPCPVGSCKVLSGALCRLEVVRAIGIDLHCGVECVWGG